MRSTSQLAKDVEIDIRMRALPFEIQWLIIDEIIIENHWSYYRDNADTRWQSAFNALTESLDPMSDKIRVRYRNIISAWRRSGVGVKKSSLAKQITKIERVAGGGSDEVLET